jgi:deoxyribodipyrimidine photolyase
MACRTLFINQEDFKDRVDLSENVLSKYIIPNIASVQDRYIKKIICKDFYDELIVQVENESLTSANETLVDDYIKPAMVFRAYARYVATANVFSTPSGFRKYREDNSDSAEAADMSAFINQANSDANYYESELSNFLENNLDDYPTYRDECKCSNIKAMSNFKISSIGKKKDPYRNPNNPYYNDYYYSGNNE